MLPEKQSQVAYEVLRLGLQGERAFDKIAWSSLPSPGVASALRDLERAQKWPESGQAEIRRAKMRVMDAAKSWAKQRLNIKATEQGPRGGVYYVAGTGQKVYVRPNPGAETVGQLSNQRFVGGLPVSAHLAEPRKR